MKPLCGLIEKIMYLVITCMVMFELYIIMQIFIFIIMLIQSNELWSSIHLSLCYWLVSPIV